jgi:5'(3')-deoxyribonucleotidase
MKRILFIYGFGGSPSSTFCRLIREALPANEYEVLCPEYPQDDVEGSISFLEDYIEKEHCDLVMGTSLGGFFTLCLSTSLPRVVINPCMMPSVELPRLHPRSDHPDDKWASNELIEGCKKHEDDVNQRLKNESFKNIGLFAEDDELLGTKYKKAFKTYYDDARSMPGGHHGNAEAIPAICQAIKDALKPVLFIDMDNVLADFQGYVDNSLLPEIKEKTDELDGIPGIFAQFPVVKGAKEALLELQEKYELYVLSTSPWNNPTALQDKQNWLKLHFGNMFYKRIIFTHHKHFCLLPNAWLVDDRPNHGACLFGDHWLHFGENGKYKTWEDVKDYLMGQV